MQAGTNICDTTSIAKNQNSGITICLSTNSAEIFNADIQDMTLTQRQSGISLNVISDFAINVITTKSAMGTRKGVLSTWVIFAFFQDPSTVTVTGTVIMVFAQSTRMLVRFKTDNCILHQETASVFDFAIDI